MLKKGIKNEDMVCRSICYVYKFSPVDLYPHAIRFQDLGWDYKWLAACIDGLFSNVVSNEKGKYQDDDVTHYGFTVCPGVPETQMWAARKLCSKGTTVLITTYPFLDGNKMDSNFESVGSFTFGKIENTEAAWHRVEWRPDTRMFHLVQPAQDYFRQGVENNNREEDR